jgi:hypothetical protein
MTGAELWQIFLGANVPDAELIALGEDIGHKREVALAPSQKALLKVCAHAAVAAGGVIVFSPSQLYQALKMWMPGGNPMSIKDVRKRLLEAIAAEYEVRKPWVSIHRAVSDYFTSVASQLPAMPKMEPPAPPAPPPAPPAASSSNGVSATSMGAEGSSPLPTPKGLTESQYAWLRRTLDKLHERPSSVSDNHLAAARNYAARANLTDTLGALERHIEVRGTGAQTEDASNRAAMGTTPRVGIAVGLAALFGFLVFGPRRLSHA